jgi:hypothetical protein
LGALHRCIIGEAEIVLVLLWLEEIADASDHTPERIKGSR